MKIIEVDAEMLFNGEAFEACESKDAPRFRES